MDIKVESNTKVESTVYSHKGEMKTHPCEVGEWYSNEICGIVNFNKLSGLKLPEGEYKVIITFEKID